MVVRTTMSRVTPNALGGEWGYTAKRFSSLRATDGHDLFFEIGIAFLRNIHQIESILI